MSDSPNGEKKNGRPTKFTQELADLICERVATTSFGIRKLCSSYDDLPTSETVWQWRYRYPIFSAQYTLAKQHQIEYYVEESIDIADDATNDWMEILDDDGKSIGWKINGDHVNRSRLRIETRKWHASKLLPKKYGTNNDESDASKNSIIEKLVDKITDK